MIFFLFYTIILQCHVKNHYFLAQNCTCLSRNFTWFPAFVHFSDNIFLNLLFLFYMVFMSFSIQVVHHFSHLLSWNYAYRNLIVFAHVWSVYIFLLLHSPLTSAILADVSLNPHHANSLGETFYILAKSCHQTDLSTIKGDFLWELAFCWHFPPWSDRHLDGAWK